MCTELAAYALWLQKDNAHNLYELLTQKRSCGIIIHFRKKMRASSQR